jgi:hypothetical protein
MSINDLGEPRLGQCWGVTPERVPRLRGVTREQVREAVLAFLHQFVSRGASPELHDLPRRLAADPELQSQLDRYLHDDMSEREAFDAMREFLGEWSSDVVPKGGEVDVFDLLSWTEWEPDGGTSDPAQWHDWLGAVAAVSP